MKQRLVGAAVLVSLVVIFVPMILSGPVDTGSVDLPMTIPTPPFTDNPKPDTKQLEENISKLKPVDLPKPVIVSKPPRQQERPQQPQKDEVKPEPKPIKPEVKPNLVSWDVQVGSFSQSKNAIALRDKLRRKRYKAFVESTKVNGKTTWRVRVGPEIKRETAEILAQKLKTEEKLPASVFKHD